jgi:hypothetical protein
MPKSKGRTKKKEPRRYGAAPTPKKRHKSSPRWYGAGILIVMGLGVLSIVLNYLGVLPGGTSNMWLWVGLGLIGLGFIGTTFWY